MPAGSSHLPDPGVEFGAFRVLPRADGGHVIVDMRRPIGRRTVGTKYMRLEDAVRDAKTWYEQGHGKPT